MSVKTLVEENEKENVVDDISEKTAEVQEDKLAALRAKLASKQKDNIDMSAKIVAKKTRSINFGVIGSGQGGSRLAACFNSFGYDAIAINTAQQDLKFIELPEENKLLLEYGLGGAAKELEIGKAAAEMHRDRILELVSDKLGTSHVYLFTTSLGGGSGAGSAETIIEILAQQGKPIVVMAALPMHSDDSQTKSNALVTLSKLAKLTQNKVISNLIVVDNAKIESILKDVSQMDFFDKANRSIVEPLDIFNHFSSMPSSVKTLDSSELLKIMLDSNGLTIYGEMTISNYEEDTAIAEAVISNLSGNLLAEGFDLTESKYVGVLVVANKKVWSKIPSSSVNYAMSMINDQCGTPAGVFKGIYSSDLQDDVVKVYSIFSGLSLPSQRVSQLKEDVVKHSSMIKNKDVQRNLNLTLDTGTEKTVSETESIKNKIAAKSNTFHKFMNNVVDKRK